MEIQTFSEEEKEEIIRYGLDKIKNSCMMSAVTLLMGYAFHVLLQSIVFLICFIALRKYAGGYHADTQKRCYVISVLIIAVALWATRYKPDNSECFVFIQSLNFIILCFLVPVDSKNRRLEQWEKERYGKKAKVQIFCMYMLCLILYLDKKQSIAVAIGVANLTVGGCVCAGKMKNILLKHKEQFRRGGK